MTSKKLNDKRSDTDTSVEIDLSDFPNEIAAYATDQFPDKICMAGGKRAGELLANDVLKVDGEKIKTGLPVEAAIIRGLLYEKILDIRRELKRGDRNDYTLNETEQLKEKAMAVTPKYKGNEIRHAYAVLEQLRDHLEADNSSEAAQVVNEAHYLLQVFENQVEQEGGKTRIEA